ncbi:MAG: C10 family peptidase [Prevotellaceae bacterium]|nr:C10 family peptidase [Prevotellaceae bacterium]
MIKKFFTLCAFVLMGLSASADPITKAKALQLAQEYLVPGHTMSLVSEAKPRSAAAAENAPYYIISRGENQGFVIVSGDDCMPAILGYTEEGDYDENNVPDNFRSWLQYRADIIEYAQKNGVNTPRDNSAEVKAKAVTDTKVDVPYLLTSLWHQESPYNDKCPYMNNTSLGRAMTGCVATAAAQIVYYWRREANNTVGYDTPTYGYGNAPVKEEYQIKKGTPIKFDLMSDSYGSEPAEYKEAVATLVATVGMSAWLTYGVGANDRSTSGQIGDCCQVFSEQFGLNGGTCVYKNSGYSETAWANLLYNELIQGRPVLYCGTNSDGGGHAVVCDGYQASTGLFHINFGWGSGYNGYFSVEDGVQGWGFNASFQGCVYGISPKISKIDATIQLPKTVYSDVTNEFTVTFANNGTLPLSNVYFFANTSGLKPASLSSAKSSDTETVIGRDKTGTMTFTAKPNSTATWYFFVTDANLNVLATASVEPEYTEKDLRLVNLYTDASSDTETLNDEKFQIIYNNKSNAYAAIANAANYSYAGTLRMDFYKYNETTSDWETVGSKTASLTAAENETGVAQFNITSTTSCPFEVGKYYIGKLVRTVQSSDDVINFAEAADTVVRFMMKESDMEVVSFENDRLTLKGHFDATMFNSATFAKKSSYKTATEYDLTQCVGVKNVSQEVNPNALYYVADDSEASGVNVVKAGKCESLSLTPGYNFAPSAAFEAAKAEIAVNAVPGKWCILTVPFAATVPEGIIAREITSHTTLGISNKTNDVTTLEAGKPYLVMLSYTGNATLSGTNVKVLAAPVENADPAFVGTFTATVTPAGSQMLNDDSMQYFEPVKEGSDVEALRGYWNAADLTKKFRAESDIMFDPSYATLAANIEAAYQAYNKYKNLASASANKALLAKVKEAEKMFSTREDVDYSFLLDYVREVQTDTEEYINKVLKSDRTAIDFTGNIENPSFESNSTKGWTLGTKEGYSSVGKVYNGTQANNYRAVGLDGKYVFMSLIAAADSSSVSISQTVEGLTPGYYRLTAKLGTDENSTVTMFAGDSTVTVNGHAFGHLYLTEAVIDSILVEAPEGAETGSLTIGVKEGRWYKADDFVLTCTVPFKIEEDEPDAITDIATDTPQYPKGIYTLQGVKVASITAPGIYIIDGKKVFVDR